ncbi:AgrD family cyclic lactone autoinducer peptide [Konateibacter massiliensis]|uniref:AgrD family cyclic lactone autoinducer peptide n=1 Tax=Konateibacter massiliensis TaxID=2002841 RepID=UPI0015D4CCD0|nr:cyclic lactone autoinducer peptide [Konateibacter massiliensis]
MYNKLVKVAFSGVIEQAESEEEKEVVVYGLEVMISTMVDILCMLLIGLISQNFLGTVVYLLCFCSIRSIAGGYHANTYLTCLLCSIFSYTFIVLLNQYVTKQYNWVLIIMTVTSYVVIMIISPILNGKRIFSKEEVQQARKKVMVILFVELLVTIGLYQLSFELYKFAVYAIITEGVFGIMGKIKYLSLSKKSVLKNVMSLSLAVAAFSAWVPCVLVFHEPEVPKALKDKYEKK